VRLTGKFPGSLGALFVYGRRNEVYGEAVERIQYCSVRQVVLEDVGGEADCGTGSWWRDMVRRQGGWRLGAGVFHRGGER